MHNTFKTILATSAIVMTAGIANAQNVSDTTSTSFIVDSLPATCAFSNINTGTSSYDYTTKIASHASVGVSPSVDVDWYNFTTMVGNYGSDLTTDGVSAVLNMIGTVNFASNLTTFGAVPVNYVNNSVQGDLTSSVTGADTLVLGAPFSLNPAFDPVLNETFTAQIDLICIE